MREILFRGKTEDPSAWVVGFLIYDNSFGEPCIVGKNAAEWVDGWEWRMNAHEVNPKTIGQYTGLKDKNGTRIFEGDILFWKNTDSFPLVLEWSRAECGFMCRSAKKGGSPYFKMYLDSGDSFEVAGNIHDNPELLKEG